MHLGYGLARLVLCFVFLGFPYDHGPIFSFSATLPVIELILISLRSSLIWLSSPSSLPSVFVLESFDSPVCFEQSSVHRNLLLTGFALLVYKVFPLFYPGLPRLPRIGTISSLFGWVSGLPDCRDTSFSRPVSAGLEGSLLKRCAPVLSSYPHSGPNFCSRTSGLFATVTGLVQFLHLQDFIVW